MTTAQNPLAAYRCPACHGTLRRGNQNLSCSECFARYPLVDAIPDFLPSNLRARQARIDNGMGGRGALQADLYRNPWAWLFSHRAQASYQHHLKRWLDTRMNPCGNRILDVGCGPGTAAVAHWYSVNEVHGLDVSVKLLQSAAVCGVRPLSAHMDRIPFDADYFNILGAFGVLCFSSDLSVTLAGFRRVLVEGGSLFVACAVMGGIRRISNRLLRRFQPQALLIPEPGIILTALETAGFHIQNQAGIAWPLPLGLLEGTEGSKADWRTTLFVHAVKTERRLV